MLRERGRRQTLALAAAAALLLAAPAHSAAPAAPVVVVVDMTQIMRDAKAAKDIEAQVDREMTAYRAEVQKREDALRKEREDLERQRTGLAPEIFNARSQDYQQQYAALDSDVQAKQRAMQQSYSDAMTKVESTALGIVADVAKERKATMVLAKAALLYMDDSLDVTAEVTQRLDEKMPSVKVTLPQMDADLGLSSQAAAPAK